MILRGVAQGVPLAHLARELDLNRVHLLEHRHEIQKLVEQHSPPTILMEGIWTGLRNFLRPLRGVNKTYLGQYTAVFEVGHNLKEITPALLEP